MPEPNPHDRNRDSSRIPPFPPGDNQRGVNREENEDIGYGPADRETTERISAISNDQPRTFEGGTLRDPEAQAQQQAINEPGAQSAWLSTYDGRRFTELNAKRDEGQELTREEKQELARIVAKRQNRNR